MAIAYLIFTIALTFVATVALSMTLYGGIDYFRHSKQSTGVIEAGSGSIMLLYVAVFHFDGLTQSIPRELLHGSLVSKSYIVLPVVVGVISTDYLLRRILPLLVSVVQTDTAPGEPGATPGDATDATGGRGIATRRSVLGVTVGVVTATLVGGLTTLEDILRSPTPPANEISEFRLQASFEAPYFPTALDFSERGYGFLTTIEGKIFRFEQPSTDEESLQFTKVASGIRYPQGVEVVGETLYTVDNGKAAGGKYDVEEGYEVLQESNGKVIAFDIKSDGSLTNKRTILSDLPVVNGDHALHQIVTGPDGRLHLSVGHLGGQKYPEMFDGNTYEPTEEDHPNYEYLGTVLSFEPDGSDVEIVARGLRNVYDLTFDRRGNLFGANNDGMSVRSKVWESLCHITEGAHFGYPEYGTFDASPADEAVEDPLWVLDGVQSTGVETTDKIGARDGVVVGLAGKVAFVPIERGDDGVFVPEFLRPEPTVIEPSGAPIIVEAGPDGFLWVGSTGGEDTLSLYTADS